MVKGLVFSTRPSLKNLKLAPHEEPSLTLVENHIILPITWTHAIGFQKSMKPSRKTLKKFGKPSKTLIIQKIIILPQMLEYIHKILYIP